MDNAIQRAIEALERSQRRPDLYSSSIAIWIDDALSALRRIKPAMEGKVWEMAEEEHTALERITNWYDGFRAAERFHGIKS